MRFSKLVLLVFIGALCSCWRPTLNKVELFGEIPVNLSDLNSKYDDFNSAYPPGERWYEKELVFSTNRGSDGGNFDFISSFLTIRHDIVENSLIEIKGFIASESSDRRSYSYVNTPFNELGPYHWKSISNGINWGKKYIFLYSNDSLGHQDIHGIVYEECVIPDGNSCNDSFSPIIGLDRINTEANECYPYVMDNHLLFCSDRAGDYDIFSVEILYDDLFNSRNMAFSSDVNKIEAISGPSDDKCPFVLGDLMVFSSNREGGFGGFDLWYSYITVSGWSDPINFGQDINTEDDEYRPIILPVERSLNDLMIFSSDRLGGAGGFDLYYVGVERVN